MLIPKPEVMRLMPTISPSAQVAVLGHPLMMSAARIRSAMPLAKQPGLAHAECSAGASRRFHARSGLSGRGARCRYGPERQVLGAVYNDLNEKIGSVDDIIIAPDKTISYAIINAGGFLQVTKHDVAASAREAASGRPLPR
jgi:hypothetical protein